MAYIRAASLLLWALLFGALVAPVTARGEVTEPLGDRWLLDRWTSDDGLSVDAVNAIAFGPDGRLWLATWDGLFSFDGKSFAPESEGLSSLRLLDLAWQSDGALLWTLSEAGDLQARSADGRAATRHPDGAAQLIEHDGVLWRRSVGEIESLDAEPPRGGSLPEETQVLLAGAEGEVWAMLKDRATHTRRRLTADGALGPEVLPGEPVPRFERGAWALDRAERAVYYGGERVYRSSSLIQQLAPGAGGVAWVASDEGLLRIRPRPVSAIPAPEGVDARVERLWWDADSETLWAGAPEGDWWAVDDPRRRLAPPGLHDPAPGHQPITKTPLPLSIDEGRWWGTQGRLVREDPETGALEEVDEEIAFWRAIASWRGPDGRTWMSTDRGTWIWDGASWAPFGGAHAIAIGPRAFASVAGGVLLGGGGGLGWAGSDDELLPPRPEQPPVRHLRVAGGRIWVATETRGICALPADQIPELLAQPQAWRCLDEGAGLGARGVHTSALDGRGRVWFSANQGLGWIDADRLLAFMDGETDWAPATWLGAADGMLNAEANGVFGGGVWAAPNGDLLYPTQTGVARLHPDRVAPPPAPPIRLVSARINGLPAELGALALASPGDALEIGWSAIDLAGAGSIVYRYRLGEGSWSAPGRANSVLFQGLPAGEHRFEVQAGVADRWGPAVSVAITRPPVLHERPEAWAGAGLSALALVGLVGAGRARAARRRQEELEAQVAAATLELRRAKAQLSVQNDELVLRARTLDDQAQTLRELYERSAAQAERLSEVDRIKRRLLANVSHELRTPLSLIIGPLGAFLDSPGAAPAPDVSLALRNAERLQVLVDQLLAVARAQSGTLRLRARRGGLGARVAAILARFPSSGDGGRLRFAAPERDPEVWCDPEMLDTVVGNLVANALEHGDGDAVEVGVEMAGSETARVTVRDRGPGLARGQAERLFERFQQGDGRRGGLGLGLALARELVELHGGEIGARAAESGGACFWFTLPLGVDHLSLDDIEIESAQPAAPAQPAESEDASGARVLLVEDNPELRPFLAAHLGARFAVTAAASAEDALAALEAGPFELLVSDIMLPGISGLELTQQLRAAPGWGERPILLISAKGSTDDRVEGLQIADDYLPKPFQVRELIARCEALLRRAPPEAPEALPPPDAPPLAAAFLARLEAFTDEHMTEDLDAERLARSVGMSRRTLHDRLRGLGLPAPSRWLRERRLARGEALLREGDYETVGEVAAAVGMSRAYFSRAIRARIGCSPGALLKARG